jgi:segregation and condensation protein B
VVRVIVGASAAADAQPEPVCEEELSLAEIEEAYLRALETADAAEIQIPAELLVPDAEEEETPSRVAPAVSPETRISSPAAPEPTPVDALQVIEALLYVGGAPLPVKRLHEVLGGSSTVEQVEEILAQLNSRYAEDQRPYEIALAEGGYRMQLRSEFESVRLKAYGHGPREVKLAQDALELLALVAYQQPIARSEIDETGKPNIGPLLRQLLRRELISLERQEGECYRTTKRFLELFGLSALDDLPQAGDFNFK